jgi:hypothetical protein
VTPQKCLETRLRLGWSRAELAAAASLAAPIVRLYEAGALDGFDDCAAALEAALADAEGAASPRAKRVCAGQGWFSGLAEAGVSWRGPEWTPLAAAV